MQNSSNTCVIFFNSDFFLFFYLNAAEMVGWVEEILEYPVKKSLESRCMVGPALQTSYGNGLFHLRIHYYKTFKTDIRLILSLYRFKYEFWTFEFFPASFWKQERKKIVCRPQRNLLSLLQWCCPSDMSLPGRTVRSTDNSTRHVRFRGCRHP